MKKECSSLFLPQKKGPFPAVVVLGGSSGGLKEDRAKMLADRGIGALSLAYFGAEGLSPKLEEIPLEYLKRAIDRLKLHPSIDPRKIGIWGTSRGAELALLFGSFFPDVVQAIAAHVPTSVIHSSFNSQNDPAWTYLGRPVGPSAPFTFPLLDPEAGSTPDRAIALTPFFLEAMRDAVRFDAARIAVQNIDCPLFLVSGKEDQMWPSERYAFQIIERASVCSTHLSYSGVGHHVCLPLSCKEGAAEFHPILQKWFAFGGDIEKVKKASVDCWEKTVAFFLENLS